MAAVYIFLALVLAMSLGHKLAAPDRLGAAAARLAGVRPATGPLLSFGAAAFEGVATLALLFEETRVLGACLAAALWVAYAMLLWKRRGQTLDCGCSFGRREKPVTASLAARAAGLAAIAVTVTFFPTAPFEIESVFAGLGFLILYLALDELLAIPQPAWRHG